jgi:hydroxymethylpyrimidine pyrophosphatase-like HAD family hydrolase
VLPETVSAVERLIASGRRVVLVTGRELDDLKTVCPRLDLFAYVVAENGALLYQPSTGTETALAQRPSESFIASLRARGVGPISVGRVIVATWEPHETAVLKTIRDLGLELQVIFNKGAVMVLPAGISKATGLSAALEKIGLSAHNAVGIGDAENDHALLGLCECGVAVANALPTLKAAADFVTTADHGAGVVELIDALLRDDLASHEPELTRRHLPLGRDSTDREIRISAYGEHILLLGADGGSALIAALERLSEAAYTYCLIAPRGGYESLAGAVSFGTHERPPSVEEILKLFAKPSESGIVNLTAVPVVEQPAFLDQLLPDLARLRSAVGRPHWLVLGSESKAATLSRVGSTRAPSMLWVAADPETVAPADLAGVTVVMAVGAAPQEQISRFSHVVGIPVPRVDPLSLRAGEVLCWRLARNEAPFLLRFGSTQPRSTSRV